MPEAERYLKEAVDQGGSDDTNYHSNAMTDDFLSGRPDWDKQVQWAAVRPEGFTVEAGAATIYFSWAECMTPTGCGSMRRKERNSNTCPMPRADIYSVKAVHDALVSNCSAARDSAHQGLALDHSTATVPDAALALALCGETGPALAEIERLASEAPNNTLVNEIYLPEVKAAVALLSIIPSRSRRSFSGRPLHPGVEGSSVSRPSIVRDEKSAAGGHRL